METDLNFKDSKYATGKRKTSIARIWLKKGTGKITVNGKDYDSYFKRANHKMQLLRPFEILNQSTSYDVKCNVKGGGCLLYTSPSPRDTERSRMPSSA